MPITRSIPWLCTSKIRSIVCGERSRTPWCELVTADDKLVKAV
jgi:hypothetical protein